MQVQQLVEALESDDGRAELHGLYSRLDEDGDGELTSEEWAAGLAANQELLHKYFGETGNAELLAVFNRIDLDGNGSLSWEEFCAGAKALQTRLAAQG